MKPNCKPYCIMHPMMPLGSTMGFNSIDANGNPTAPIINQLVNFGLEYVWHCHILSHEEMDMMRPVSVALPPNAPSGLTAVKLSGPPRVNLAWNDNSLTETQFLVQRQVNGGVWDTRGTIAPPLDQLNTTGPMTFTDPGNLNSNNTYSYRIVAQNTVGYGGEFKGLTVQSTSKTVGAPTGTTTLVSATAGAGPGNNRNVVLTWSYAPGGDQTGFTIQRANNPAFTSPVTTIQVGDISTYNNTGLQRGRTYYYRVRANNAFGWSAWSNVLSATTAP